MKKFTQQELEDAYQQMKQEREEEKAIAKKAASLLGESYHPVSSHKMMNMGAMSNFDVSPKPQKYCLVYTYSEYDRWPEDEFKRLTNDGWVVTETPTRQVNGQKAWAGWPGMFIYGFKFYVDFDSSPKGQQAGITGKYLICGQQHDNVW